MGLWPMLPFFLNSSGTVLGWFWGSGRFDCFLPLEAVFKKTGRGLAATLDRRDTAG